MALSGKLFELNDILFKHSKKLHFNKGMMSASALYLDDCFYLTWHADGLYCYHLVGPGDLTNMPYVPISRMSSCAIFFHLFHSITTHPCLSKKIK